MGYYTPNRAYLPILLLIAIFAMVSFTFAAEIDDRDFFSQLVLTKDQDELCADLAKRFESGSDFFDLLDTDHFILSFNTNSDIPVHGSFFGKDGIMTFSKRLYNSMELHDTEIKVMGVDNVYGLCAISIVTHIKSKQTGKSSKDAKSVIADSNLLDAGEDIINNKEEGQKIRLVMTLKGINEKYIAAKLTFQSPCSYHHAAHVLSYDTQLRVKHLAVQIYKQGFNSKKIQEEFFHKDTKVELNSYFGKKSWSGITAFSDYLRWMSAHILGCRLPRGGDHHHHHHHPHGDHNDGTNEANIDGFDKEILKLIGTELSGMDSNNFDMNTLTAVLDKYTANHTPDEARTSRAPSDSLISMFTDDDHHHHDHHNHHGCPHRRICRLFPSPFPYVSLSNAEYATNSTAVWVSIVPPLIKEALRPYICPKKIGMLFIFAPSVRIKFDFNNDHKIDRILILGVNSYGHVHGNWRGRHYHNEPQNKPVPLPVSAPDLEDDTTEEATVLNRSSRSGSGPSSSSSSSSRFGSRPYRSGSSSSSSSGGRSNESRRTGGRRGVDSGESGEYPGGGNFDLHTEGTGHLRDFREDNRDALRGADFSNYGGRFDHIRR